MIDIPMTIFQLREALARNDLPDNERRELLKQAIILLRADRKMASEVSVIKKTKASSVINLLEDFKNQMSTVKE
jgi:hypothetical protein